MTPPKSLTISELLARWRATDRSFLEGGQVDDLLPTFRFGVGVFFRWEDVFEFENTRKRACTAEGSPVGVFTERKDVEATFLTTRDLASRWRVKPHSVKGMRSRGDGPPYVRLTPSAIRYDLADVEHWEAQNVPPVGRR